MKRAGTLLLLAAAAVLGAIALRAKEPTYVPPHPEGFSAVPVVLSGAAREGYTVRALVVEGMCCSGCSAKLYERVLAVDGVAEAAVDPLLGDVQALVRTDVATGELERALTFDKYSARAR